jgi:ketosteroid isomerase-like protein
MDNVERNRQLAHEFFARLNANDLTRALDLVSADASWWIAGKPGLSAGGGDYDKEKITALLNTMFRRLKDGLRMTVRSSIAEGDKVAVEVESRGELTNGRMYNNEYHMLLTMRDGRIVQVREYMDTQHAFAVWLQA